MVGTFLERTESARVRGALGVLVGITGLLVRPIHEYYFYSVPGGMTLPGFLVIPALLWFLWPSVTVWGLAALVKAEIRSLTPLWASLAVPFSLVPGAILSFREPITDAVPPPDHIKYWQPPAGPIEVVVRALGDLPFWFLGPSVFLLLGVAWARGQRGWFAAGVGGLFLYAGIHDFVYPYSGGGLPFGPLWAAIPGALVFYIGYRLAAEVDTDDDRPKAAAQSGTKSAGD